MPVPSNIAEEAEVAAAAVKGFLASTLVDLDAPPFSSSNLTNEEDVAAQRRSQSSPRLTTGWRRLDDEVLWGGFTYGRGGIVCVNYDGGATATTNTGTTTAATAAAAAAASHGCARATEDLIYSTLTSHLLSYPSSQAYFIDPLGQFSPFKLHDNLISSGSALRQRQRQRRRKKSDLKVTSQSCGVNYNQDAALPEQGKARNNEGEEEDDDEGRKDAAVDALDRVAVMRVFDFTGLMEAIDEIRERLGIKGDDDLATGEGIINPTAASDDTLGNKPKQATSGLDSPDGPETITGQLVVADSQPGSEDDGEITIELENETPLSGSEKSPSSPTGADASEIKEEIAANKSQPALILVPSIHSLISPFMRINHIRGHAYMLRFARSIQHMTASYPLCCLVCNSTVISSSTSSFSPSFLSSSSMKQQHHISERRDQRLDLQGPSAFALNAGIKPALGRTWPYCIDLNLLLTRPHFPVSKENQTLEKVNKGVTLLEVLADRYSNRVGRWCAV